MPDGRMPEPGGWNRIQIEVEDLEATVEKLRAAGATFRNEIVIGNGGKQILIDDPSGNPIELFEPARGSRAHVLLVVVAVGDHRPAAVDHAGPVIQALAAGLLGEADLVELGEVAAGVEHRVGLEATRLFVDRAQAASATFASAIDLSVPATVNLPSLNSMSAASASISVAASCLPFSMMASLAAFSALPPTIALRAPWPKFTVITVDLAEEVHLGDDLRPGRTMVDEIVERAASPLRELFVEHAQKPHQQDPNLRWFRMPDEMMAAQIIDSSIFTRAQDMYVDIDTDIGPTYGAAMFWDANWQESLRAPGATPQWDTGPPPTARTVSVVTEINHARFKQLFVELMTKPIRKP